MSWENDIAVLLSCFLVHRIYNSWPQERHKMAPGNIAITAYHRVVFPCMLFAKFTGNLNQFSLTYSAPEVFSFTIDWLCWVATYQDQTRVYNQQCRQPVHIPQLSSSCHILDVSAQKYSSSPSTWWCGQHKALLSVFSDITNRIG